MTSRTLAVLAALQLLVAPVASGTSSSAASPGSALQEAQADRNDRNGAPGPFAAWGRVLAGFVDAEGLVDYAGLAAAGLADLEEALRYFAETDPTTLGSADAEKAFWINAYNAVVIGQVVERYPIESVRDVGMLGGLIGGFFKRKYPVAGREMSADDIEHGTLRERWPQDAEIHWTLVCAAFGCPRLLQEPYRAEGLDATLDARGREFLSLPRALQIDRANRTLYLSSYFDWYEGDFERVAGEVLDYVLRFVDEETGDWIRTHRDELDVQIMDYDWTLNDQPNGPRSRRPVTRD